MIRNFILKWLGFDGITKREIRLMVKMFYELEDLQVLESFDHHRGLITRLDESTQDTREKIVSINKRIDGRFGSICEDARINHDYTIELEQRMITRFEKLESNIDIIAKFAGRKTK